VPDLSALKHSSEGVERTFGLMRRARESIAYDRFDSLLERPFFWAEDEVFPFFAVEAEGCTVVDSAGRSYVDWVNGFGPVVLGYRHPEVEAAITAQLAAGPTLSLMHPVEIDVAEALVAMVPCAEQVAFGKNGSDVLNGALRIARAATGRDLILHHGFHGFHEWYMCTQGALGIPDAFRALIEPFPYNDLNALSDLFEHFRGQVAAVVMEPVNTHMPDPGYLQSLIDLAHENGALVVFDEMVTGFRLAPGGAQEYFGVMPDIGCFGKAIANGMPLAAIAGKEEYLRLLTGVGYGMTYRGETLSLAAARATLRVIREESVCDRLAQIGRRARQEFGEACARTGVRARLIGPDARLTFAFEDDPRFSFGDQTLLFVQECLKRGVLTNGNLLPSCAIDDAALERSIEVFEDSLRVVADALGDPRSHARRLSSKGFLDRFDETNGMLRLGGWLLINDAPPESVELIAPAGGRSSAQFVSRPDVAEAFPALQNAGEAGYVASIPAADVLDEDGFAFTILASRNGEVAFRCRVMGRSLEDAMAAAPRPTDDGFLCY
jgi:glutamate-1-semialdehyde 2,1-aminomutase